VNVSTSI
jgi:hypothetical protein